MNWPSGEEEAAENKLRYALQLAHVGSDICGDDLIRAGCRAGPVFKSALGAALAAKLDCGADAAEQLRVAFTVLKAGARP